MMPLFRKPRIKSSGFTLTEVLTTVMIIGILVSMGYAGYRRSIEQTYLRQAEDVLLAIYSGERSYFFRRGAYLGGLTASNSTIDWRAIDTDDPNDADTRVAYNVFSAANNVFTAIAYHTCGSGTATRSIIQDRSWGGNWNSAVNNC
jgi:prepilin-type N-terminal cleavage/methylation domain-containing protein